MIAMWNKYIKLPGFLLLSKKEVQRVLDTYLKCKVLDAGAAYGTISEYLMKKGFDVVAIDTSKKMVEECRKKGIDCREMDAKNTTFKNDSFDLVITDGLLEHFKDCTPFLKEEKRISKKYVLNFVPKDSFINKILEKVQRVPKEYRKPDKEWYKLHKKFFTRVEVVALKRLIALECRL
jgi:SAM-dependent methyltransferase